MIIAKKNLINCEVFVYSVRFNILGLVHDKNHLPVRQAGLPVQFTCLP